MFLEDTSVTFVKNSFFNKGSFLNVFHISLKFINNIFLSFFARFLRNASAIDLSYKKIFQ